MSTHQEWSAEPYTLALEKDQWEMMRRQVERHAPQEACGLLGGLISGDQYDVKAVIPTRNQLASPVRFQVDPRDQIEAFNHFEKQGLELLAIYHSHPGGPWHPSPADIDQAYYPGTVQLIWFIEDGSWNCRGYLISDQAYSEVEIKIKS
jgi:proteasome lid subunit RPN8/RPN11